MQLTTLLNVLSVSVISCAAAVVRSGDPGIHPGGPVDWAIDVEESGKDFNTAKDYYLNFCNVLSQTWDNGNTPDSKFVQSEEGKYIHQSADVRCVLTNGDVWTVPAVRYLALPNATVAGGA